jgi:hypothetical protein
MTAGTSIARMNKLALSHLTYLSDGSSEFPDVDDAWVWTEGFSDWKSLKDMPELREEPEDKRLVIKQRWWKAAAGIVLGLIVVGLAHFIGKHFWVPLRVSFTWFILSKF